MSRFFIYLKKPVILSFASINVLDVSAQGRHVHAPSHDKNNRFNWFIDYNFKVADFLK